eukprot:CAMPEP_0185184082 /NCGR_PEP_ID=MMETSP1140-20130426/2368_1 /TAXON_ID=298111 /ORGANISM="Pavlova sp., Strain CCMP459" /LENGTH=57 /DNA_ID=CAMNT_0027750133 /DNA_START=497 /DNA_END=670 /DNA_ORIENTATION=+
MTEVQKSARPFLGSTVMLSLGKRVPPPASTSDRYMKKVYKRGPHAEERGEFWSWWTL